METNIFNRDLLVKHAIGETVAGEKVLVETWLAQSAENRAEFSQIKASLRVVDDFYRSKKFDSDEAWQKVSAETEAEKNAASNGKVIKMSSYRKFFKYAAVLVFALLLGAAAVYVGSTKQFNKTYSEISATENEILNEYLLPDGTLVTLNSNSKLIFPKKFTGGVREVTILGEAFFDVEPNPEKPFIINAGNTEVRVLGTSFNVNAYPENEAVEVTVASGKVQVARKNTTEMGFPELLFLLPGEKATVLKNTQTMLKTTKIDRNYLAWKTHHLVFDQMPLEEVLRCIEKVYHVKVELADPTLKNLLLTAHFEQEPVEFILDVIRITFDLELSAEKTKYAFSAHQQNKNNS